jgi:cytochrome c-type biogenesis protein CcmH
MRALIALVLLLVWALAAPAVRAEETLADPALEARAEDIFLELRCPVCESEPISQSRATMSADMRVAVRQLVAQGRTDEEIREFFRLRYGDYVLLRPSLDPVNWLLWGMPLLMLAGGVVLILTMRRTPGNAPDDDDADDPVVDGGPPKSA